MYQPTATVESEQVDLTFRTRTDFETSSAALLDDWSAVLDALLAICQKTGARHELDFMLTLISAMHRAIVTRKPDELL